MRTLYKHCKGTTYEWIGDAKQCEELVEVEDFINALTAYHHETEEPKLFFEQKDGEYHFVGEDVKFVLYRAEGTEKAWYREYEDFHGDKEWPDGKVEKRFVLIKEVVGVDHGAPGDATVKVVTRHNSETGEITVVDHEVLEAAPVEQPYKKIRPKVDIMVPDNYDSIVKDTLKAYKKWLNEDIRLNEKRALAETEEEKESLDKECLKHFKERYAGVYAKDTGGRLSVSQLQNTWTRFMEREYRGFLEAHVNLTMSKIVEIGLDKFIYAMGWRRPSDASRWRNNKLRIGACCHCEDQFMPMMLQYNHGLCVNCRPLYSSKAIRKYIIRQLHISERYDHAQHDLLMDFHIVFYHDPVLRRLFLVDSETAKEYEAYADEVPEWAKRKEIMEQEGSTDVV